MTVCSHVPCLRLGSFWATQSEIIVSIAVAVIVSYMSAVSHWMA